MVSFQCHACGDVVKKPKLDQHHNYCHSGFDCIDCHTTFNSPAEYKGHTQCISEAEKYQKSLYKGPKTNSQNQNKNDPFTQNDAQNGPAQPDFAQTNHARNGAPARPKRPSYNGRKRVRDKSTGANCAPLGGPVRMFASTVQPNENSQVPSTDAQPKAGEGHDSGKNKQQEKQDEIVTDRDKVSQDHASIPAPPSPKLDEEKKSKKSKSKKSKKDKRDAQISSSNDEKAGDQSTPTEDATESTPGQDKTSKKKRKSKQASNHAEVQPESSIPADVVKKDKKKKKKKDKGDNNHAAGEGGEDDAMIVDKEDKNNGDEQKNKSRKRKRDEAQGPDRQDGGVEEKKKKSDVPVGGDNTMEVESAPEEAVSDKKRKVKKQKKEKNKKVHETKS